MNQLWNIYSAPWTRAFPLWSINSTFCVFWGGEFSSLQCLCLYYIVNSNPGVCFLLSFEGVKPACSWGSEQLEILETGLCKFVFYSFHIVQSTILPRIRWFKILWDRSNSTNSKYNTAIAISEFPAHKYFITFPFHLIFKLFIMQFYALPYYLYIYMGA